MHEQSCSFCSIWIVLSMFSALSMVILMVFEAVLQRLGYPVVSPPSKDSAGMQSPAYAESSTQRILLRSYAPIRLTVPPACPSLLLGGYCSVPLT